MDRYYNRKVKVKRFNTGDLVLRKISQATKDPSQGKLGPAWEGPYEVICHSKEGSYFFRRPRTASTMEYKTFEEVLPVRNLLHFKLSNLHISMYDSYYFRHS